MATENGAPPSSIPLFGDVHYVLINPPENDPGFTDLIEELDHHGAQQVPLDANNRISDRSKVSHIITNTVDFPDYVAALEDLIPVVKPTWIRNSVAKNKQQNPRSYSPDPALFLSDVVLHCADVPDGDKEAIIGGVLAMGGLYTEYLSKLCTHLVALSDDDPKVVAVLSKNPACKVVLPHWFDDCLRLRRRISEEDYRLPDPKILRKDLVGVPPTPRNNPDIFHAMHLTPTCGVPEAKPTQVFKGRSVLLSDDLDLPDGIKDSIRRVICDGGGSMAASFEVADIYVCQYREDAKFAQAVMDKKDVGNLNWLYHLITHDRWTNPMLRLLHFPLPQQGIPGFEQYTITVSNYTGHARIYLENLIIASGAKYTKSMTSHNTHLIAAHTQSEKYAAAREWSIEVVNHLWLEDSFAQHKPVAMTIGRYSHFPNRTNLGEVVGQTPVDRAALHKYWITPATEATSLVENAPKKSKSRKTTSEIPEEERLGNSRRNRHSTLLTTPRPEGKENRNPNSPTDISFHSGGRGAKARALSKLHDAAVDIALYDKERKRVGGVIHGGRRSINDEDKDSPKRKREEEEEASGEESDSKKPRTGSRVKVMVSMYEKWTKKPETEQADRNKLRNLGIQLIDAPTPSSFILCAPRIGRTRKFMCALAYAPEVVSTAFLDHCLEKKEIPMDKQLAKFRLKDKEGEKTLMRGMGLQDALKRAKSNERKLLKDWQIFCTPNLQGGWEIYRDVVEVNGGKCREFRDRMKVIVSRRGGRGDTQDEEEKEKLFLISGKSKDNQALWKGFKDMAHGANMEPVIVNSEWLLNVVMAQDVNVWRDEWRFE